jgi:hypothetical protein
MDLNHKLPRLEMQRQCHSTHSQGMFHHPLLETCFFSLRIQTFQIYSIRNLPFAMLHSQQDLRQYHSKLVFVQQKL